MAAQYLKSNKFGAKIRSLVKNNVVRSRLAKFNNMNWPLFVGKVFGLCAGARCGAGFLGEGGGARDVRARAATGDDDNLGTTPFFLAEII